MRIQGIREEAAILREDLFSDGKGWVLFFVASGWLFGFGTRFIYPAVLPFIKEAFNTSNATAGLLITSIWISFAAVQFLSGLLADRLGERIVLVGGILLAVCGVFIGSFAPVLRIVFLSGILFGLGTGLFAPPRVTVLSNMYSNRASFAIGVTFAAGSIGSAGLPVLGSHLATQFNWRVGFSVVIIPFLSIAYGLAKFVPKKTTESQQAPNLSLRETVSNLRGAMANRQVVFMGVGLTMMLFILQGLTAFLPTYFVTIKGLEPQTAATVAGLYFATGAIVQPLSGSLGDRFGIKPVLVVFAAVGTIPLFLLVVASGIPILALVTVALGIRLGMGPLMNAYLAAAFPEDIQGVGYGLIRTIHVGIASTGATLVGSMADFQLFNEAFLVLGGISAVSILLFLQVPPQSS